MKGSITDLMQQAQNMQAETPEGAGRNGQGRGAR